MPKNTDIQPHWIDAIDVSYINGSQKRNQYDKKILKIRQTLQNNI